MRRALAASGLFVSALTALFSALVGCVGEDPAPINATPDPNNPNGNGIDGGNTNADGSTSTEGGGACVPGCASADALRTCKGADEVCALGCLPTPSPHCARLEPAAPVEGSVLALQNVNDLTVAQNLALNTETGAIGAVRAPNKNPEQFEVISGIGFKLFKGVNVAVFSTRNFTINDTITMAVLGKAGLAIVATDQVTIKGVIDARGHTAAGVLCDATSTTANTAVGPGGTAGGVAQDGFGVGGGKGGDVGGGGGGGFGGIGGAGGKGDNNATQSLGGIAVPFPTSIAGGFGGGRGGGGSGGAGGGAVQIVAGARITIGGGTEVGGINVGGCGGVGGANNAIPNTGGGGGGSGGGILLQSPRVILDAKGVLAANGGAGGSGGGRGRAGDLSDQPALPLATAIANGRGGAGSGGTDLGGTAGQVCTPNPTSCFSGGGGGAAGRIMIQNADGTLPPPNGARVSPAITTPATVINKVARQ